jgi:ribosomal protein L29
MLESKVMKELRKVRDKTSEEIKDMTIEQKKEYFMEKSVPIMDKIKKIRADKLKAI